MSSIAIDCLKSHSRGESLDAIFVNPNIELVILV